MITPADSIFAAIILVWQLLVCVTLGELFCRAVCGYVLVRCRAPEIAFVIGYAVAALAGLIAAGTFGSAKTIVPALFLSAGILYLWRRRQPTPLPEFLIRYRTFRETRAGRIAVGAVIVLCCLVGSYRLPALVHLVTGRGVAIGSNIFPDEMRTLGLPISIAAHGLPLRFPLATETLDVYPPGPFLLSAGHIAWAPRFTLHTLIADSMCQAALYGIAALLAAGLWIASPTLGLFVVLSAVFSVSYNLWNLHLDEKGEWFVRLYGYYQINDLRSTIAWQPLAAMVWIMNHAVSFSALLIAGMWLAASRTQARRIQVWGPVFLLTAFAFLSSLDIALMAAVAIALILIVELRGAGWKPKQLEWWIPAAAIFLVSGLLFAIDILPILLRQTEPPSFNPIPIIAQPWFNVGVLASTLGPYFLLLLAAWLLRRGGPYISRVWLLIVATGLVFCMSFQYHSILFWRFSMASHLLFGLLCGLAISRVGPGARVALMAAWAVFLIPGVLQTRLIWLQGWELARTRPPEMVEALRWIQTRIPIRARVAELPSEQAGLISDVNFLRTGNGAGAAVTAAYHPQIGYRSYRTRMASLTNGIAANDFIIVPAGTALAHMLSICGASQDYSSSKLWIFRITDECRARMLSDEAKTLLSDAREEAQLNQALATRQPEKLSIRMLQRYVMRYPDAMWLLRKQLEITYWTKGQYREAAHLVRPLASLTPCVAEAHYSLAYSVQMAKGDLAEAIREYDRALECGYTEFWVRYNRGGAYANIGQFAKARADFQRARQLDPSVKDVEKTLEWLSRR